MVYRLEYTDTAQSDMARLKHDEPAAFEKLGKLLLELMEHPTTGTGHPEPLKGNRTGQWSRRITQRHRLVYAIREHEVIVLILTAYGHYGDK